VQIPDLRDCRRPSHHHGKRKIATYREPESAGLHTSPNFRSPRTCCALI
jgi:hypothetical protein